MTVDNDIQNAIRILYGDKSTPLKKVKIYPNHSLKHFKKYKLDNREVLTRINSLDEVLDLFAYNANVTCFSDNKLDEYFLKLLIQMHNIRRKGYMNYIFIDFGSEGKLLSKKYYDMVRDSLDDETRYFFDEMYKYCLESQKSISRLIERQQYEKKVYDMYVKNYLLGKYDSILENNKFNYINLKDTDIVNYDFENKFDFINLSYNVTDLKDISKYLKREETFKKLLKDNGKIQSFISFEEYPVKDHKIINTRSFLDPYTKNDTCKKEYAYMYRNSQQ